jgi:twitching motility protein PilT
VSSYSADKSFMLTPSRQLGEFLVERKVLSRDALEQALIREEKEGTPLASILMSEGLVGERDLVAAVANQMGVEFYDFERHPINPQVDRLIPAEVARRHAAVAVAIDGTELVVAMEDPGNSEAITAIEAATGWQVRPVVAVRTDLRRLITSMYPSVTGENDELLIELDDAEAERQRQMGDDALVHELHINDLLERVVDLGGSDLHLTVGIPPSVRVHGDIKPLTEFEEMNGSEIRRMLYGILTQKQREKFENELELDTSHSVPGVGRFRVNIFLQRDSMGAVMRVIPYEIVPFESLGLPEGVIEFSKLPRGLVLVTGPTGSGKSTSLASLVDVINSTRPVHIMTVEDPIEFLHNHKTAVVNQREVGEDTHSFGGALKHVLRQDPDVILVGEMRDLETISTALTAAETGHLVFATLHTQDAPQSVDRVIDVFPSHQQQQIRVQLASALQGVVTQQLVPKIGGKGRVVAAEVLVATAAVRNLIREGKTHQIYSAMQSGGRYGMVTMDQSLAALVRANQISLDSALERCASEADLRRLISGQ